jgi:hypothetical protein
VLVLVPSHRPVLALVLTALTSTSTCAGAGAEPSHRPDLALGFLLLAFRDRHEI